MSGILLPGQENRPTSEPSTPGSTGGSGLVLPSSARRRSEAVQPTPDADAPSSAPGADTAPDASAEGRDAPSAGAGRGGGRRLSAEDLLFPPTGAQVQCPNCGTPFVVPIFSIIDLGANPELKQMLLGGQINAGYCPRCGAGGQLSAPLMVHVPEKQWLGVLITAEARVNELQRQRVIGEMTQALMRKLPQEQRKGYMLQPRQYADWDRFAEQLWEFEGVSAEMLRRQRAQADLLESLLGLADDRAALEIAVNRSMDLIDRDFFAMLDRMFVVLARDPAAAGRPEVQRFTLLREALIELTPAGRDLGLVQQRVRDLAAQLKPETTREELLQLLLDEWGRPEGRQVGGALMMSALPLFDYNFMLTLSERMETTTDVQQHSHLEEIRTLLIDLQERLQQSNQSAAQEASELLQELLQAPDLEAALRANAELIDETFLSMLAASIQQAERNNSKAAVRRLRQVYDMTIGMLQEGLPADLQLMNVLLSVSENRADLKRMLEENRGALTPEFLESLSRVEEQMRSEGRDALADRVKSIRSQARLMM